MSLRHDHPNFWLVVVGDILGLGGVGAALAFVPSTSPTWRAIEAVAPLPLFGALFLLAGAAVWAGMGARPMLFRAGLAAGAGLCTFFAAALLVAIVEDLADKGSTPGAVAPALFVMAAIQLIAQAREPRSNPDAARR